MKWGNKSNNSNNSNNKHCSGGEGQSDQQNIG